MKSHPKKRKVELRNSEKTKSFPLRLPITTLHALYQFRSGGSRLNIKQVIKEGVALLETHPDAIKEYLKINSTFSYARTTKILNTTIDEDVMKSAASIAERHGITKVQVVDIAIRRYLIASKFDIGDIDSPIVQPEAIKIVRWKNPWPECKLGAARSSESNRDNLHGGEQLRVSLNDIPRRASVFLDATILFLGITYRGLAPEKTMSLQCSRLLDGAGTLDFRCFTTTFEIARLCELLDRFAESRVPPERLTPLFRAVQVVAVNRDDLLFDCPGSTTLAVRAAESAFRKWGSNAAVATASSDFDELYRFYFRNSNKSTLSVEDTLAIYTPTDIRK